MDTAMTLNWLEMRRVTNAHVRQDQESRVTQLGRENARLMDEVQHLRRAHADLAASADLWIRLYERALTRANQAEAALAQLTPPGAVR
jgi:hypothetical protein